MVGALAFTAVRADAFGGFLHPGGGFLHPGGGFLHPGGGFLHPGGGFLHSGGGFLHQGGGFLHQGGGFQANTNHFGHGHRFRDRGFGGGDYDGYGGYGGYGGDGDYCDWQYPTSNARYCGSY